MAEILRRSIKAQEVDVRQDSCFLFESAEGVVRTLKVGEEIDFFKQNGTSISIRVDGVDDVRVDISRGPYDLVAHIWKKVKPDKGECTINAVVGDGSVNLNSNVFFDNNFTVLSGPGGRLKFVSSWP